MSSRPQASGSSRSHDERHLSRDSCSRRRLPPVSAAAPSSTTSREPPSKRLRPDHSESALTHTEESSTAAYSKQQDETALNLDSWLDEYDAGIDQEESRRKVLEQSRRRREAILEKYSSTQAAAPSGSSKDVPSEPVSKAASSSAIHSSSASSEQPANFSLIKSAAHADNAAGSCDDAEAQVSAAELDPDADRVDELARLEKRRQSQPNPTSKQTAEEQEYEEIEVTDDEDDAELDMFALSDDDDKNQSNVRKKKTKLVRVPKRNGSTAALISNTKLLPLVDPASTSAANLSSNWDDSDGYLRTILGETLDERYQISAVVGKGMFASVVRARDLAEDGREVAIKIVRVQESMYKAGLKEVGILRRLNETDPDDRKHVVRLERRFDYKGHLCMVFESLGMNLRDLVRRYGRDVGLNLQAVRAYAHQLFLALSHLAKQSVMHADIKPDNVLVNDAKTSLKLCDLGSASVLSEMEITPYLVSRFYRAPEIILGQAYDCSIDVWSVGCTLYELATGKILFPGRTNNHMLLLMQEVRGRFTTKQIRKSQFGEQHFDEANAFLSMEPDKSTGSSVVRRVMLQKPSSDLRSRLLPADAVKQLKADEVKMTNHFIDLLERCLELDPAKRIKPKDALEHAFLAHVAKPT
ncbi:Non-specific serine/threonine protein kinase [Pseudozyma hubeiensis]|nr:Non-specific serine/threonine protein kinase [Pseudozyma hubeiensis]